MSSLKTIHLWQIQVRMARAFHLLPAEYESQAKLEDVTKNDHWYRYRKGIHELPGLLTSPEIHFGLSPLTYDRSLEYSSVQDSEGIATNR